MFVPLARPLDRHHDAVDEQADDVLRSAAVVVGRRVRREMRGDLADRRAFGGRERARLGDG